MSNIEKLSQNVIETLRMPQERPEQKEEILKSVRNQLSVLKEETDKLEFQKRFKIDFEKLTDNERQEINDNLQALELPLEVGELFIELLDFQDEVEESFATKMGNSLEDATETFVPEKWTKDMNRSQKIGTAIAGAGVLAAGAAVVVKGASAVAKWLKGSVETVKSGAKKTGSKLLKYGLIASIPVAVLFGPKIAEYLKGKLSEVWQSEVVKNIKDSTQEFAGRLNEATGGLLDGGEEGEAETKVDDGLPVEDEGEEVTDKEMESREAEKDVYAAEVVKGKGVSLLAQSLLFWHDDLKHDVGIEEEGEELVSSILKKQQVPDVKVGQLTANPSDIQLDVPLTESERNALHFLGLVCMEHKQDIQEILDKRSDQKDVNELTLKEFLSYLQPSVRTMENIAGVLQEAGPMDLLMKRDELILEATEQAFAHNGAEELLSSWYWFEENVDGFKNIQNAKVKFSAFVQARNDAVLRNVESVSTNIPDKEKNVFVAALQKVEQLLGADSTINYLEKYIPDDHVQAKQELRSYIKQDLQVGDAMQLFSYVTMAEDIENIKNATPKNSSALGAFMLQLKTLDVLHKAHADEAAYARWKTIFETVRQADVPLPPRTKEMLAKMAGHMGISLKNKFAALGNDASIMIESFIETNPEAVPIGAAITASYLYNNIPYARALRLRHMSYEQAQDAFGFVTEQSFRDAQTKAKKYYSLRGRGGAIWRGFDIWRPGRWPVVSTFIARRYDYQERFFKLEGYAKSAPEEIVDELSRPGRKISLSVAEHMKAIARKAIPTKQSAGLTKGGSVSLMERLGKKLQSINTKTIPESLGQRKKIKRAQAAIFDLGKGRVPSEKALSKLGFSSQEISSIKQAVQYPSTAQPEVRAGVRSQQAVQPDTPENPRKNKGKTAKATAKAGAAQAAEAAPSAKATETATKRAPQNIDDLRVAVKEVDSYEEAKQLIGAYHGQATEVNVPKYIDLLEDEDLMKLATSADKVDELRDMQKATSIAGKAATRSRLMRGGGVVAGAAFGSLVDGYFIYNTNEQLKAARELGDEANAAILESKLYTQAGGAAFGATAGGLAYFGAVSGPIGWAALIGNEVREQITDHLYSYALDLNHAELKQYARLSPAEQMALLHGEGDWLLDTKNIRNYRHETALEAYVQKNSLAALNSLDERYRTEKMQPSEWHKEGENKEKTHERMLQWLLQDKNIKQRRYVSEFMQAMGDLQSPTAHILELAEYYAELKHVERRSQQLEEPALFTDVLQSLGVDSVNGELQPADILQREKTRQKVLHGAMGRTRTITEKIQEQKEKSLAITMRKKKIEGLMQRLNLLKVMVEESEINEVTAQGNFTQMTVNMLLKHDINIFKIPVASQSQYDKHRHEETVQQILYYEIGDLYEYDRFDQPEMFVKHVSDLQEKLRQFFAKQQPFTLDQLEPNDSHFGSDSGKPRWYLRNDLK